ncbi:MAG: toll/interleukin-1 receptor domain-containing protein [Methylococcales bacterium]|nr:toll/interleukin-1 receptor domain-containing protein [Methylococcales bacterium]
MVNVFISYRRDDSAGYAGRLADSLEKLLGKDKVFRDVADIKPGEDFVKAIKQNLQNAKVFLVWNSILSPSTPNNFAIAAIWNCH